MRHNALGGNPGNPEMAVLSVPIRAACVADLYAARTLLCCLQTRSGRPAVRAGEFLKTQAKRRCRGERALDVPDGALAAPCQSTFRASEQTRSLARALWGFAGEGGSWGLIGKELSAGVRRLGSDCRPASPACAADEDAVRWATGARSSIDVSDFIRSELNA